MSVNKGLIQSLMIVPFITSAIVLAGVFGQDYLAYKTMLENPDLFRSNSVLFLSVIKNFKSVDLLYFYLSTTGIFVIAIISFLFSRSYGFWVFLCVLTYPFVLASFFHAIRGSLASTLIVLGLVLICNNNRFRGLFFITIGLFFHISLGPYLILSFLGIVRSRIFLICLLLCLFCIIIFGHHTLPNYFVDSKLFFGSKNYIKYPFVTFSLFLCLKSFKRESFKIPKIKQRFFENSYKLGLMLGSFMSILSIYFPIDSVDRFSQPFIIFILLLIIASSFEISTVRRRIALFCSLSTLGFLLTVVAVSSWSSV